MKLNLNIDNVNYIKIVYKDKNDYAHCIKASLKRMDEREIVACAKFEESLLINVPQEVMINIACDNGLYKAATQLKHIEKEEPYIFFTMIAPEEIDYQQKREYFRVKINENALISYEEEGEKVKNIACETYDLSANGVRLILDARYNIPSVVNIKLYLSKKIIDVNARYIRTDEEDNILKASFSFADLQESDLDCISQICFQKQLEARRKSLM